MSATGWKVESNSEHDWQVVSEKITNYVRSLNFGYRTTLMTENIKYYNSLAKLVSNHEVELTNGQGDKEKVTAKYILLAVGGRPTYPDIPGAR